MSRGYRRYSLFRDKKPEEIQLLGFIEQSYRSFLLRPEVVARRAEIDERRRGKNFKLARYKNGSLRRDLFYVSMRDLALDEHIPFMEFLHVQHPLKGDYTVITQGTRTGDYAFVVKDDATLFRLFWGR